MHFVLLGFSSNLFDLNHSDSKAKSVFVTEKHLDVSSAFSGASSKSNRLKDIKKYLILSWCGYVSLDSLAQSETERVKLLTCAWQWHMYMTWYGSM